MVAALRLVAVQVAVQVTVQVAVLRPAPAAARRLAPPA